jgi:hypothetical protein
MELFSAAVVVFNLVMFLVASDITVALSIFFSIVTLGVVSTYQAFSSNF